MLKKQCRKCYTTKPISDFYDHPKTTDGHYSRCKECAKRDAKLRTIEKRKDPNWVESERVRTRDKYHRLNYKVKYSATESQRCPFRVKARSLSQNIPCPDGHEKHHWSYNEDDAKDVIILGRSQHSLLHARMRFDKDSLMYRSNDGVLLNSRAKHLAFIDSVFKAVES